MRNIQRTEITAGKPAPPVIDPAFDGTDD
jgi:hypothetical protein